VQYKKKYFIIIAINILLILFILLFSIPAYKYLSKKNLNSNTFVKDQIIINPEAKSPAILDRVVKIKFIAKVNKSLDWEFEPLQENIQVKIGESKIIKYKGKNVSNKTITSTANFLVDPEAAQAYLIKTECFCFTEQTLKSGESQIFTMVFYIDPALDKDWYFDDLQDLVFTYEFSEYKS
tara:strand:+ start:274 stop:813 length:540 start_codon:yes stop_codon:yes gene_type:complete